MALPEAIKRKEMYLQYLTGTSDYYPPDPVTREEQYLYYLCKNGGIGGGGTVTPEQIEAAVNKYLTENPVQAGATAEQAAQIQENKESIELIKSVSVVNAGTFGDNLGGDLNGN